MNTVASIISTDYAVLLLIADKTVATTASLPAHEASLFANGIAHGSLVNAIGDPIAANVAMLTMGGMMEFLSIAEAGVLNIRDIQSLIP